MNTLIGYLYIRTQNFQERRKKMTSIPVKDAGSVFTSLTSAVGNKTTGIGQADFQAVLNNQTQRKEGNQTAENSAAANRSSAGEKPGSSLKAKDADRVQTKETEDFSVENDGEEMTPEQMEEAMEVLETAAAELMQQTADLLGISVEEVQSLMADMGLDQLDILDPAKLNGLFLQASGAEDSYALVTDEGLYEDYQTLMKQLETALQECGRQLETDPGQMSALLTKLQEEPEMQSEAPVAEVSQEKVTVESSLPDMSEMAVQGNAGVDAQKDAAASGREHGQKENHGEDKGQQSGNLFIQNLRAEEFRPEVQQTAETMRSAEADTENIMRQIMDYMKIQLKADTSSLEMQLHPASLGTVQVQIASKGGTLTANFIAQNETVKAALESQMVQLVERFDEQGVKVEAIEVTVQTHEFERNLQQGRGGEQQNEEPARRGRTRRINLNDALSMENMEEEDVLAADMMAANGNTVDYMA